MGALAWIQLLSTGPIFAARAFLAAFLVALVARFGDAMPFLADGPALQALRAAPPWFTSDAALIVLGVLAFLEGAAQRSIEARRVLTELDPYLKFGAALAINLGLVDAHSGALLQQLGAEATAGAVATAGVDPGAAVALLAAAGAWSLAILRKRALGALQDADEEDDLGLVGALVWLEELFVVGGAVLLVLLPIAALALAGLTAVTLAGVDLLQRRRAKSAELLCGACASSLHASAPSCGSCGQERAPVRIGLLGHPLTSRPVTDLPSHRHRLVAARRCPRCATSLRRGTLAQDCGRCGHVVFADQSALDAYLRHLARQLPRTMLICGLFGAVPLVGLVPGILWYRLSLLGGLRRYLPPGRSFVTRQLVRLLNLVLIALQWIPLIGAAMLPLLCVTNFLVYRRALLREGEGSLRPAIA